MHGDQLPVPLASNDTFRTRWLALLAGRDPLTRDRAHQKIYLGRQTEVLHYLELFQ
jgi:hypothetical protein